MLFFFIGGWIKKGYVKENIGYRMNKYKNERKWFSKVLIVWEEGLFGGVDFLGWVYNF